GAVSGLVAPQAPIIQQAGGHFLRKTGGDRPKLLGWYRLSVERTLSKLAAQPQKNLKLLLCLYTLCHRIQSKALPESHDCGDNLTAVALLRHETHETTVHFQFVKWERLQMRKA